ncbi:MAG: hypothetical protein JRI89_17290 [Deltaproteobacteria bacterium]|nr:hypothetical protein [Deltaproteobacteria bacterium]
MSGQAFCGKETGTARPGSLQRCMGLFVMVCFLLSGCTMVGPNFNRPQTLEAGKWLEAGTAHGHQGVGAHRTIQNGHDNQKTAAKNRGQWCGGCTEKILAVSSHKSVSLYL